jgi:hypothetical protein
MSLRICQRYVTSCVPGFGSAWLPKFDLSILALSSQSLVVSYAPLIEFAVPRRKQYEVSTSLKQVASPNMRSLC